MLLRPLQTSSRSGASLASSILRRSLHSSRTYLRPIPHARTPTASKSIAAATIPSTALAWPRSSQPALRTTLYPRTSVSTRQARHCSCRSRRETDMCSHNGVAPSGGVSPNKVVLPTNVKPVLYDITLEPNFDNFQFKGQMSIEIDVVEPTNSIALNFVDITIDSTELKLGDEVIGKDLKLDYNADDHVGTFSLDRQVPADSKLTFSLDFTGDLNDKRIGFYRAQYKDKQGNKHWMATTQMEPADARRAFPCFDEPAIKAKYSITLIAEDKYTCLSNMDVKEEKQVPSLFDSSVQKKSVAFNTSPVMSSYLVATIIAELNYIETNDFRVPVRVYAASHVDIETGRKSLEIAAKGLAFYEENFGHKLPLPKMDMVAIPEFNNGAMENWGLITYRTLDLMLENDTPFTRERVFEVVLHELSHQWFGNLVTMEWWDGLWLNEGFATWMSWYACDKFFPEWRIWETYLTGEYQSALITDSLRTSHPIEVPMNHAKDVDEIFDGISYAKGSCIVRMIAAYLGEEVFLKGVRHYMNKHQYKNTVTTDLWDSLSEVSGKPVSKMMSVWTRNIGFPVLDVTEDKSNNTIRIRQNRYLRAGEVKPEEDEVIYPAMLNILTSDGTVIDKIMDEREVTIQLDNLDFYKINHNSVGFYRTHYSAERLQSLAQAAKDGHLSTFDKLGLIDDVGSLSLSGQYKVDDMLEFMMALKDDDSYFVWSTATAYINSVKHLFFFEDKATYDAFENVMREFIASKVKTVGWEFKDEDGHIERQFKQTLFGAAARYNNEIAVSYCRDRFAKYVAGDASAIRDEYLSSVFNTVMRNGGESEYNQLMAIFNDQTKSELTRNSALASVGSAKQPELMDRTIEYVMSDEVENRDYFLMPLGRIGTTQEGHAKLWNWFVNNYDAIEKKAPAKIGYFNSIVHLTCGSFTSEKQLQAMKDVFAGRDMTGFKQTYDQTVERIGVSIKRIERCKSDVTNWLSTNNFYDSK